MSYDEFEQRVLALGYESDAPITPASVAYRLGCPVREAKGFLDRMLAANILALDSDDEGNLIYELPGRAALAGTPPTPRRRTPSPPGARALNAALPGAGSLWAGRLLPGLAQLGLTLGAVALLWLHWKDFGDAEHKPWLLVLGGAVLTAWLWAFKTTAPADDEGRPPS